MIPTLKQTYVADDYANPLILAFEGLRKKYNDVAKQAKVVASAFVGAVNSNNKRRFDTAMQNAVGIDISSIIQDEGIEDVLRTSIGENVSLIQSIPDKYLKDVETAIFSGTQGGQGVSSLIDRVQEIGNVTRNRAKLIARDQTSKLNGSLNRIRQENLGVEEYVWVTAGDGSRVRATHRANGGKKFRWDAPPASTGHPGHDVNCRCVARAIIEF